MVRADGLEGGSVVRQGSSEAGVSIPWIPCAVGVKVHAEREGVGVLMNGIINSIRSIYTKGKKGFVEMTKGLHSTLYLHFSVHSLFHSCCLLPNSIFLVTLIH